MAKKKAEAHSYIIQVERATICNVRVSATCSHAAIEKFESMEWDSCDDLETVDWSTRGDPELNE